MDKTRLARVLALILVGVLALTGCGRIQVSVERPTLEKTQPTPTQAPPTATTVLPTLTHTPIPPTDTPVPPTSTPVPPTATSTPAPPTPTPTLSPTPVPLPTVGEVLRRYDEEIRPLVERLQAAQESPPDFQLPLAEE